MDLEEFGRIAEALDGVHRGTAAGQRRWTYRGRLVAREVDEHTVVVRMDPDLRHGWVSDLPGTFSVPRAMVRHHSVLVDLDGNPDAITQAVRAARDLQRAED